MFGGGEEMGIDLSELTEKDIYKKSSQEITALLYQACIEKLGKSIQCIKQKKYVEANQLLQRCNDILYRLGAGINYEAGMIADQLEVIYNYMADQLVKANIDKNIESIQEVLTLLKKIADSWSLLLNNGGITENLSQNRKAAAYEQNVLVENKAMD